MWIVTCINADLDTRINSNVCKDFLLDMEYEITSLSQLPNLPMRFQLDNAYPHLKYTKAYLKGDSIFTPPHCLLIFSLLNLSGAYKIKRCIFSPTGI